MQCIGFFINMFCTVLILKEWYGFWIGIQIRIQSISTVLDLDPDPNMYTFWIWILDPYPCWIQIWIPSYFRYGSGSGFYPYLILIRIPSHSESFTEGDLDPKLIWIWSRPISILDIDLDPHSFHIWNHILYS